MTGVLGGAGPSGGGVLVGAESGAGKARSSGNSGGGVPGGIPSDATVLGGLVLVGGHLGSAPPGRGEDCRTQGGGTGDLRFPGTLLGEESGTLGAAALPPECPILRSPEVGRDRWCSSYRVNSVSPSTSSTKMSPIERRLRGPTAAGGEGAAPA